MEVIIDPTSGGAAPEELEEIIYIKTVQYPTQNGTLADSIAQTEDVREYTIPPNIGILEHVNYDEDSDEDLWETGAEHLPEEQGMPNHIKCLGHVRLTGEDFRTIPKKISNSFNNSPGTHRCGLSRLVGKLKIIQAKSFSK